MRPLVLSRLFLLLVVSAPLVAATDPSAAWSATLDRAAAGHQAVVVYFRPERCAGRLATKDPCADFERLVLDHATIRRRLGAVTFVTLAPAEGHAGAQWGKVTSGLAVFDSRGVLRARWDELPDATAFATVLDAAAAAGGEFARARALVAEGDLDRGEIHVALGLIHLGEREAARRTLASIAKSSDVETRQLAAVAEAMLLVIEEKSAEARTMLKGVVSDPASTLAAAQAWLTLAVVEARSGNRDATRSAAAAAAAAAPEGSRVKHDAEAMLAALGGATGLPPIEIVPFAGAVSGDTRIGVRVNSPAVARVEFALDGKRIATAAEPPFAVTAGFGRLPERHTITATALDAGGRTLGTSSITVNDHAEAFWVRIVEPSSAAAPGPIPFRAEMRLPDGAEGARHTIAWNDDPLFAGAALPARVTIPDEPGILKIVSELPDGRSAEDAVVLNMPGGALRTEVHVVELPITARERRGALVPLAAGDLEIRENGAPIEPTSVSSGTELPLTLGILIDASSSMWDSLPDVQEAAIRFLGTALGPGDRAFVIAFGEQARLVHPATTDRAALERAILSIRANGRTALFDAIAVGVLQIEGIRGRRALVAFSDGADNASRYDRRRVVELTRRLGVPIYVVAGDPPVQTSVLRTSAVGPVSAGSYITALRAWNRDLQAIADAAGGSVYRLERPELLDATFDRIAETIRGQQIIVLQVDGARREHEWRELTIRARKKGVEIHGPAGYYAP